MKILCYYSLFFILFLFFLTGDEGKGKFQEFLLTVGIKIEKYSGNRKDWKSFALNRKQQIHRKTTCKTVHVLK